MRFRGSTSLSIDSKGRVAMPKFHRERLLANYTGGLVVTFDAPCLLIYPEPVWEEIEDKINALGNAHPRARMMQRRLIGLSESVDLDSTGRILLPARLRKKAGIDRKVVLMGQGKKFELWDEQMWDQVMDESEQDGSKLDLSDMTEEMLNISL